jgi:restriction system protein
MGKDRPQLRLIDGDELVDLIFEHYDALDPEWKGRLPMRRVFVPDRSAAT